MSTSGTAEPRYRLDRLGWAQFERLCREAIELEAGASAHGWRGRADQAATTIAPAGLTAPGNGRVLPGPALVCAIWVRPSVRERRRWRLARRGLLTALADERAAWPTRTPAGSAVLLVSIEPDDAAREDLHRTVARGLGGDVEVVVAGPEVLSDVIDAHAHLRRRLPSLLGVRTASPLAPQEAIERSSFDHDAAVGLARVFMPTGAYARTLAVLTAHGFAVVTGPPEMGKTAIARMIGLAFMSEGWEVHECVRADDVWARFDRERSQLFIADDAFGSTEYRPEAAERWALDLDRVLRSMDDRHWLIWTSRPAPLNAGLRRIHREHGVERFPKPAEVQVDAADLEVEEKALILFRHARDGRLSSDSLQTVRRHGWTIVSHPHFTPERIRRLVSYRLRDLDGLSHRELSGTVEAEIREPTTAMATSLRALPAGYRAVLVGMLDTPPGPVSERALAASVRRHSDGLPQRTAELVDRLADHFLRPVPPTSVTWVHPSWRDLVIDELAGDPDRRCRFLERCSLDGVLLAISTAGGGAGERTFPLLTDDRDWDLLGDRVHRLAPDLDDTDLLRLLGSLGGALAGAPSAHAKDEVEALSATVLAALRAQWDQRRRPVPVALLGEWFALVSKLTRRPPGPDVASTWIELVPTSPVEVRSDGAVRRFEDWLQLAFVLSDHEPALLAAELGFPHEQAGIIRAFVEDAAAVPSQDVSPPVASCLRRLEQLVPELSRGALRTAVVLELGDEPEYQWQPRRARPPAPPERSLVSRILSDLAPDAEVA